MEKIDNLLLQNYYAINQAETMHLLSLFVKTLT